MPLLVLFTTINGDEYVVIDEADCVDKVEVDEDSSIVAIAEVEMAEPWKWPLDRVLRAE